MHEFLATTPFDLYELSLFRLVVQHGSFTKAAQQAGLTQSAITRQIQGIETSLGFPLLERTTRTVRPTAAGEFLFAKSGSLIGGVEATLQRLREGFGHARKELRVGVSRSIGLAHLPGFFHANLRRSPEVAFRVSSQKSGDILSALDANDLDVGVLCCPKRLPLTCQITHRFEDAFTLIASQELAPAYVKLRTRPAKLAWLLGQTWLLPEESTTTGGKLRGRMNRQALRVKPAMQLDSFDLIINLVSLGMGIGFAPIRALALYGRRRSLQRLAFPERFHRELVVVIRRQRQIPEHLANFIENVLF